MAAMEGTADMAATADTVGMVDMGIPLTAMEDMDIRMVGTTPGIEVMVTDTEAIGRRGTRLLVRAQGL